MKLDLRVVALEDMYAFGELIKFKGGMHTFGDLHKELCQFISRPQRENNPEFRRRITLLPREHRKSTINTVLYSMWRIYRNPNIRIAVGCNVKKLAQSFIRELRFYFEDEELQETVWNNRPHISGRLVPQLYKSTKRRPYLLIDDDTEAVDRKIVWNSLEIQMVRTDTRLSITKEPTVSAVSVGMTLSGTHFDLVILDDIVDWDNSKSPTKAMSVEEWAEDIESVLKKDCHLYEITPYFKEWIGDELIINGTPYYKHDYYHTHFLGSEDKPEVTIAMLAQKEYVLFRKNIYVNNINSNDGYIFPEIFDDVLVQRLKKRIKTRRFSAQYLLKIISADNQLLLTDDVKYISDHDLRSIGYSTAEYVPPQKIGQTYKFDSSVQIRLNMVVDLSVSSITADNCAVAVGGYDEDSNLYCVDMLTKKLTPSQLVKEIYRIADKWQIHCVYLEKGGYQEAFAYTLRESPQFKIRPLAIVMYYHSGNKKARIEYQLEPLFKNGKFYTFYWVVAKTALGTEIEMFPSENATDDGLDVLATLAEVSVKTRTYRSEENRLNSGRHLTVNTKYGGTR